MLTFIKNISSLCTLSSGNPIARRGDEMQNITEIKNGANTSIGKLEPVNNETAPNTNIVIIRHFSPILMDWTTIISGIL